MAAQPEPVTPIGDNDLLLAKPLAVAKAAPSHSYRPDIDGLRTLAVVPVVLFHAYPHAFPGGFIGVDIFFVISGFLISGILFKQCRNDSFTYAGFYARRVRRIFPTLILVLSATFWLGYLYLMAPKVKAMAATMLAGSLFSANLQVLSLTHSYFDIDVKTNPLLHLWSLGVEEQFYIFWPLLASLLMRLSYRKAIALQLAVVVVSFGINVSLLGVQGSNKWSFYMPLSRFWQMALGGLLAYLHCTAIVEVEVEVEPEVEPETETEPSVLEHAVQRVAAMYVAAAPSSRDQVVSIVGLGLVLVGFASVNEDRLFPGFWALLPTLGATLLIAAGPDAAFNKHVLGHPLLVYIGKISYCLYLWHWPLLVFAIERYPDASSRPAYMAPWVMLGISLLLSVLTYEDVEKRLRRRTSKLVTPLLVLCVMALGVLAALAYASPTHYSAIELDLAASMDSDFASTADMSVVATTAPAGVIQDVVPTATLAAVVAQVNASTAAAALNASTDLVHSTVAPVAAAEIKATVAPTPAAPKHFAKTTVKMARHAIADGEWDKPIPGYCPTDTPYITTAKLREPFPFKDPTYAGYPERCQAINPRHEANGVIVVLGDSHGDMSKPRFAQLFNESIAAKQPFPTVVFKTRWGRAMLPCRPEFAQNIEMLKTLKPNVALFVVHWVQYLNPGAPKNEPASHPPVCCMYEGAPCKEQSLADVDAILAEFQSQLLAVSALGIKVFVVDQSPEYARMNPKSWIQGDKVKLPAPVSRAAFRKEKAWLFERLHPTFTAANATVIDYADDYSDGDTLKLTDAYGEPTMCFGGHLSTYTARKHLHVLDRVVQAALVV